jgi:hypothetical protein
VLLSLPPSLNHKCLQMKQVLNFASYGSGTRKAFRDPQENFPALVHKLLDAGEAVLNILSLPKMGRWLNFGLDFGV